jgi:hypothetical protein
MSKYFFYLRTLLFVAGVTVVLMNGGAAFSQETSGNDSNSDNELGQSDQRESKSERKSKRFETKKAQVLENIGKKRAILDTFESCVKTANSREDMKSCRTNNKSSMETLRSQRKEMKAKRKEMREKRRKQVNSIQVQKMFMLVMGRCQLLVATDAKLNNLIFS